MSAAPHVVPLIQDSLRLRTMAGRFQACLVFALLLAGAGCSSSAESPAVDSSLPEPEEDSSLSVPDEEVSVDLDRSVDDIPVAHTPEGGYGDDVPGPVLAGCGDPLVAGAPDLRGWWEVTAVEIDGEPVSDHPIMGVRQRVEQCADRVVVTAGGVVHDMRADGTEENGVNDVAEIDYQTPITVVATFEDGVHVLRPVGLPIEVTRTVVDDELVWVYAGIQTRSRYLGPPDDVPQGEE